MALKKLHYQYMVVSWHNGGDDLYDFTSKKKITVKRFLIILRKKEWNLMKKEIILFCQINHGELRYNGYKQAINPQECIIT